MVTCGLHGNEPAGLAAGRRVLQRVHEGALPLRGRLLLVAGNRVALARRRRFIDQDLNRGWTAVDVAALQARGPDGDGSEDRERRELLQLFGSLSRTPEEPISLIDLHSTSGPGVPFACLSDTLRSRQLAQTLPVPLILGLEEAIDGSLLGYLSDQGHRGVAVEGGQSEAPETVDNLEAATWLLLVAAGALRAEEAPWLGEMRAVLSTRAAACPAVVEVRHRHVAGSDFVMEPGFVSFQPIAAGQAVGRDRQGPVLAPEAGRLLMPRYQGQGDDGFFLVRDLKPAWLGLSALVRRLGLDWLIRLAPGVARQRDDRDRLLVAAPVVSGALLDLLFLCGFRQRRREAHGWAFSRRRPG